MCGAPGNEPESKIHDENDQTKRSNENAEKTTKSIIIVDNAAKMEKKYIIPQLGVNPGKPAVYPVAFDDFEIIENTNGSNGGRTTNDRLKSPNDKNSGEGSLSSGISIVTISSVTNSDPDPDPEYSTGENANGTVKKRPLGHEERWQHTALQVSVPFFIAGIGTIGAGLVLQNVEKWQVFQNVPQILILVPSLLGLKGNLDMCLASRLCTQANLGNMSAVGDIMRMIVGNLALVQIQAIVAATIVSFFATGVYAAIEGKFVWDHALLITAASVTTATCSCFVLDIVMIIVIMLSYRYKMNPDNLATPLAASFGDVVSVSVLSAIASFLYLNLNTEIWISYVILGCYLVLLPLWIYVVLKNKYTRNVLTSGWLPVLSALFISGLGGLVLSKVVNVLNGFLIFQPIINGIGGNLVSVQASRISTTLHQTSLLGILPSHSRILVSPWRALVRGVPYAKSARILIAMAVPGQLVFVYVADYLEQNTSTLQVYFVISYLLVAVLQVILLLYVAHVMIHAMWRFKIDPDNSAIPYLTALGDLSGTLLLGGAFWFLKEIHHEYGK
ncbi:solute carrier family 41 member 1-like [Venturia canescens]|uniref:solute carrier family 41 member 1-like n=1 Tax=Venturia canescens TaxID=32260 RepID=UPI001C9BC49A|nr:solute carrier family 41 member 1-like [Venturia canescens]XP_043282463.1 solute carrier family 41 member 1-like [Venturia canescens]XP_043282465.1 solute carrier family 41 member 1-like [Venturia canescens]XP_043282466.1 solute carrier family 41 member 1-like [Venturia canescens]XP_043282467.1 solute carrier family 41 member 1-like [Venturia canescens]